MYRPGVLDEGAVAVSPRTASYLVKGESDEFKNVLIVPVAPRGWRDAWAVLRGRYAPSVYRVERLTVKGYDRMLKETWAAPLLKSMNDSSIVRRFLDEMPREP